MEMHYFCTIQYVIATRQNDKHIPESNIFAALNRVEPIEVY